MDKIDFKVMQQISRLGYIVEFRRVLPEFEPSTADRLHIWKPETDSGILRGTVHLDCITKAELVKILFKDHYKVAELISYGSIGRSLMEHSNTNLDSKLVSTDILLI